MKYLGLGYYAPEQFDRLSPAEQAAVGATCKPYDEKLYATGKVFAVASLGGPRVATIRPRNGRSHVTDGPFAEAKEIVGSFFIVEADDFDEAVRLASMHPAAIVGEELGFAVEVRPIDYYVETPGS